MNFPRYTRVLLALASGALLALSFPNYNLPFLAWGAVCLLILACYRASVRAALVYGFLHGLIFYPLCLPWMATVMQQYGNVNVILSGAILGLVGIAGGILSALFGAGVALAARKGPRWACAAAPFLWVAVEFLRGHLPIFAFPWNLLGYAATNSLALLQIAAVTGIYGLSMLVAAFNAFLAYAVLMGRNRVWRQVLVAAAVVIFVVEVGPLLVPEAPSHYVAHLVQTNFPQSEEYPAGWDRLHAGEMNELEGISVEAGRREPGPIIWPEAPAPLSFQDPVFAQRASKMAQDSGQDLLLGVVDWKQLPSGQWFTTNSAVLVDPTGRRRFTYDKIHLVPFGEYVPLRRWLTFAGKLTADIGDFAPGSAYAVGQFPGEGSPQDKFAVFICYEAIFPEAVRRFVANGADLLVNMSNDGWFGRSAAPSQHLMMARVRAAENRRWLLRATNNGYTADVDPYGRIISQLNTDFRGELDAPFDFRSDLSLYTRLGDWLPWLCVLASLVLLGLQFYDRRSAH